MRNLINMVTSSRSKEANSCWCSFANVTAIKKQFGVSRANLKKTASEVKTSSTKQKFDSIFSLFKALFYLTLEADVKQIRN